MNDLKQETWITLLISAIHYFLQDVFIAKYEDSYRLIVIDNNKKLVDKTYKTMEDAKTDFYRVFYHRLVTKDARIEWSHEYLPEVKWLMNKFNKKPAPMPPKKKKKVL